MIRFEAIITMTTMAVFIGVIVILGFLAIGEMLT